MKLSPLLPARNTNSLGIACGVGAALCWSFGFVVARHGVLIGLSPFVIALHRFVWAGLVLLPIVAANGFRDIDGIGWYRGFAIAIFGGFPLAFLSYLGNLFVPLGHGALIQPSCAALGGMALARLVLKEPLPRLRIAGALVIVLGLGVIGAESIGRMGSHGVAGDLLFVGAGVFFAIFGMLLRRWRIGATRATAITSVLSIAFLPGLLFRFDNMLAAGLYENLLQAVVQGTLAGAGATYLFARSVILLGASRAVLFPSLVPPFTLLIGFLVLGEVPSISQFAGLAIVIIGFQLTQRG
jgi:drug/metabolite transporter (DMT)-like permease